MWSFETDSDYQDKLDWVMAFVKDEVAPLDYLVKNHYDVQDPTFVRLIRPLQKRVKAEGLWACHLGPELGGPGYGQVKLALLNEILGRTRFAPIVFGTQAPDTGNAEILAHFGTAEQKARYLRPLLDNEIVSCFTMTEPEGGADPTMITTLATKTSAGWSLSGEKWYASNAAWAEFFIVAAVTDPDAAPHERMSMFIVPKDSLGIEIIRDVTYLGERGGSHSYLRFNGVELAEDQLLGKRGGGFLVAQTRLGGGRIHHAMRTIGEAKLLFDMMCERVLSRRTKGSLLADKQMVQEKIADCWTAIEQFRLLVLRTAWLIDKYQDYNKVRKDIAAVKAAMPKLLHDVAATALHLHGSLGLSDEMPFMESVANSFMVGLADGPTEVHKVTVARQVLRDYMPGESPFPSYHGLRLRAGAQERGEGAVTSVAVGE